MKGILNRLGRRNRLLIFFLATFLLPAVLASRPCQAAPLSVAVAPFLSQGASFHLGSALSEMVTTAEALRSQRGNSIGQFCPTEQKLKKRTWRT